LIFDYEEARKPGKTEAPEKGIKEIRHVLYYLTIFALAGCKQ
jgi:hypothetical protein